MIFPPRLLPIHAVAISPDGQRIVAISYYDKSLWALQIGTSGETHTKKLMPREDIEYNPIINIVALSPNGQYIASGHLYDDTLNLWNIKSGYEQHTLQAAEEIRAVSFSPKGRYLASIGTDVTLWDVSTRRRYKA